MKVESLRSKLKTPIILAEKMVGKNLTLPVLGCIVLEAKERQLFIRSTNLDVGLEISLPVKVERGGIVAIRAGVLGGLLSSFSSDEKIYLELTQNQLAVKTGNHRMFIKTESGEDFPSIPKPEENSKLFSVSALNLLAALRSVVYAASSSNIKPEIASVFLHNYNGNLTVTATDSFRLAEKFIDMEKGSVPELGVIIPARNVLELIKMLDAAGEGVFNVQGGKNLISFSGGHFYFTSRLIDGVYPDYRQIMPPSPKLEVVIGKQELVEAMRLMGIFLDRLNRVSLSIKSKDGLVELKTSGEKGEDVARIKAEIRGRDDWEVNFNLKYLADVIPAIAAEKISFRFTEPTRPMMVRGDGDQSFSYLVMPLSQ